ncbi:MAG: 3-isopropylmalate dehydratase small subunit [Thermoguttaceae bacterium]|jgi:3-isopropylmalate/(R)-2-methylmalate dehydratase small subunit|nr:3-isopropylmalate dehydratase small subunit [Thermoguttaceae bacterium]MBQ5790660.1 3-isopropylmalate dehydratase small subunit [Thermoguttaceae bacterium]MBR4976334.1 3-isopropylmalate dehydratase small subunit [Thermoguttaceae bacterium]
MQAFVKHEGLVVPMDRSDVDTDQLVPKQFLKRVERSGFGKFLFFDWRYLNDEYEENPEFELNRPEFRDATILLARRNFGCGSSREHAPWAVADYGFRVVLASSFADIFYNNSFKNGYLPARLTEEQIEELFQREAQYRPYKLTVDLENCVITDEHGLEMKFEIDAFRRENLLNGWDDIGLTLRYEDKIAEYEKANGVV